MENQRFKKKPLNKKSRISVNGLEAYHPGCSNFCAGLTSPSHCGSDARLGNSRVYLHFFNGGVGIGLSNSDDQ